MKRLVVFLLILSLALCSCELAEFFSVSYTSTGSSTSESSSSTSEESSSEPTGEIVLNYTCEVGGTIIGESNQLYTLGEEESEHTFAQVTASAQEGYSFVAWSDGVKTPERQDTLSQSTDLVAYFAPIGYARIEYRADVGGSIIGKSIQYIPTGALGEQVEALAIEGYVFVRWSDTISREKRTDVGTGDHLILTAKFKQGYQVTFESDENMGKIVGINPQVVMKGKKTTYVSANPEPGYRFVKWSNGETSPSIQLTITETTTITAIYERDDLELPALIIKLDDGKLTSTLDQSFTNCSIAVENAKPEHCGLWGGKIRGRGNTSFQVEKRSYKIKLDDAFSMFGNGTSREWTLISNHFDLSLIRNYLAYSLALNFDKLSSAATSVQFVDLYINDEYRGVYLVCEQVETGKNRVDIDMSWDNVDTGYLIELDDRLDGAGFYLNGQFYGIKDPDTAYYGYTPEHTEFIRSYTEQCYNAIYGNDYELVKSLIDVDSFAQAYIIFEMFNCYDVGFSSFFMHKDAGGKMCCGPVWDFDRSVGNVSSKYSSRNPESLYAKSENAWFYGLLRHEEFKALVGKHLHENEDMIRKTLSDCYASVESCKGAFDRNFKKWKLLGTYVYPNPTELNNLKSWQAHVDFNKSWLERSLTYLLNQYPTK